MPASLKALTWAGMAIFLLIILVPFWWIASMSFKTYEQIQFATSIYVPNPFTWENYTGLWLDTDFQGDPITMKNGGIIWRGQHYSLAELKKTTPFLF